MRKLNKIVCLSIFIILLLSFSYSGGYRYFLKIMNPLKYEEIVLDASSSYGVSPALVYGIMRTESGFNPKAESRSGAVGLMQIMPETFEWLKKHSLDADGIKIDHLSDPKTNIIYGTYFISYLFKKYGTEKEAICAYNAGMGNVDKWLRDSRYSIDGKTLKNIPFKETRDYVEKVLKNKKIYNKLYYEEKKGV